MNRGLIFIVRQRAQARCEYCHLPERAYPLPFHADHIVALQHGGQTTAENLALACLHCNRHKGPNVAGIDQVTGQLVRLFNPRTDLWSEHFGWNGHFIAGRTAIGRASCQVLAMNEADFVSIRQALVRENVML